MKYITFKLLGYTESFDEKTNKVNQVEMLSTVEMEYNEQNLELAKQSAYKGEYTIEDDGIEEVIIPSQLDTIEAQVVYTAMMTNTLLEV